MFVYGDTRSTNKKRQPLRLPLFVVAPLGASLAPPDRLSRRLHNQAKPSLNARIQASERRLLRERKSFDLQRRTAPKS